MLGFALNEFKFGQLSYQNILTIYNLLVGVQANKPTLMKHMKEKTGIIYSQNLFNYS